MASINATFSERFRDIYSGAGLSQTLTDQAILTWDASLGHGEVTLGGNRELNAISNASIGVTYYLKVTQDGSGNRALIYGSNFRFESGDSPNLSTFPNSVDILEFTTWDGTIFYGKFTGNYLDSTIIVPSSFLVYFDADTGVTTSGGDVVSVVNQGSVSTTIDESTSSARYGFNATGGSEDGSFAYFSGVDGTTNLTIADTGLGGLNTVAFYSVYRKQDITSRVLDIDTANDYRLGGLNNRRACLRWDGTNHGTPNDTWDEDEWGVIAWANFGDNTGVIHVNSNSYAITPNTTSIPSGTIVGTTATSPNNAHDLIMLGWTTTVNDVQDVVNALRTKYKITA